MAELAIGMLVFVTTLVFGIHLAESGYLSLKVQEAATSALWDTTGKKLHDIPMFLGEFSNAAAAGAAAQATARYQNFDGRTSVMGGTSLTQVFTQGHNLNVQCGTGGGSIQFGGTFITGLFGTYRDNGGLQCDAQADVDSFHLTQTLWEGANGFFPSAHNATPNIHVCSGGRAVSGSCAGGGHLTMMLDDWGLADQSRIPCLMVPIEIPFFPPPVAGICANINYWMAVATVYYPYALPIPPGGQLMVQNVMGIPSPISDYAFFLSAAGEETNFLQPLLGEQGGVLIPQVWPTSPGGILGAMSPWYTASYSSRSGCFLGRTC